MTAFREAQVCGYLYGISLRIFLVSLTDTVVARRSFLLRFLLLLESKWLLNPLFRLILPLPVTRKRLAAALLVLILGTRFSFLN